MLLAITPETEIYTNVERKIFLMVDERKDGEVFCRTFKRGEVLRALDSGSAVRMPKREFSRLLDNENAVRVGVEELTWIPVAELKGEKRGADSLAARAAERIDKEFFGVNLTDNKLEEMAAIIEEETSLELIEAKHQMADGMVAAFESQIRGWQLRAAEGEQREAQLVEALKYARRFLNSIDHDTAYIDAALTPPTGETK